MKKLLTIICLVSLLVSCSKRQGKLDYDKIVNNFKHFVDENGFSGVIVVKQGKDIIYKHASGIRNHSGDELDDIGAQFLIAEQTKEFTAAALLKALYNKFGESYKDEDKILKEVKDALHNSIEVYIPADDKIWQDDMPQWAKEVTIHQLLSNSSGIKNFEFIEGFNELTEDQTLGENSDIIEKLIALIAKEPLLYKAGQGYNDSNSNYLLLSLIIERLTGKTYSDYLQQEFFDFLELKNTRSPSFGNLQKIRNRSYYRDLVEQFSYDITNSAADEKRKIDPVNIAIYQGSVSIISNVLDLAKWNEAFHKGENILNKNLYNLMIENYAKPYDFNYGYGLIPGDNPKYGKFFTKTGTYNCYQSFNRYYPDDNTSIIFFSNRKYDEDLFNKKIEETMNSFNDFYASNEMQSKYAHKLMNIKYPDKKDIFNLINELNLELSK